jgi:ankyrin repeat protein
VSLLLDWGAEALAETKDRNLPIHLAAASGHAEVVTQLLKRGNGGASEQVSMRNSLGQRAAEVSLDIATAEIFRQIEGRSVSVRSSGCGDGIFAVDHYAGRTPYHEGSVLLHNARSDVVLRLLHKTQHPPDMRGTPFGDFG